MSSQRHFPTLPTLEATWAPIYLEPIMHSGEKITIAVAGTACDGEWLVMPTISEAQLKCIYGQQGTSLFRIVELCMEDLSDYLRNAEMLKEWDSPLSGVTLGNTRQALGDDLSSIIQLGMRQTASFSGNLVAMEDALKQDGVSAFGGRADNWTKSIQEKVIERAPNLTPFFNRRLQLVQNARSTRFDYVGKKYVANFGKLIPTSERLSSLQTAAKAKLWDLEQLRDTPILGEHSCFELILWRPSFEDQAYSEKQFRDLRDAMLELSEEAKKRALATVPVHSASEASDHIFLREAA